MAAFELGEAHMETPNAPIRPAATVACLRDGEHDIEVLLVRRSQRMVFYGAAWVFPGGRVDPQDAPEGIDLHDEVAARNAATRETQEETSITLDAERLVPLSHWTTPPGRPRRFSTWFFLGRAMGGRVVVDEREIDAHRWVRPSEALSAQSRGEITLPPPTFVTLRWLLQAGSVDAAVAAAKSQQLDRFVPRIASLDGHSVSMYEEDAGYASLDPTAPGRRHRLSMRPGAWRYERS